MTRCAPVGISDNDKNDYANGSDASKTKDEPNVMLIRKMIVPVTCMLIVIIDSQCQYFPSFKPCFGQTNKKESEMSSLPLNFHNSPSPSNSTVPDPH